MFIAASLGLGTRIVTELTVLELRGRGIFGSRLDNDELMRGVATTVARLLSWIE